VTLKQQQRALSLYRRYKTHTAEYKDLAESLGMNTGELNSYCWHREYERREAERLAKTRKATHASQ